MIGRPVRDRGQSSVELALTLPILMFVFLGLVQVGLVVVAKVSATHTAREVARTMAVDPTADSQAVATQVALIEPDRVQVQVGWEPTGLGRNHVVVTVTHAIPPIIGLWAPNLLVGAEVRMLVEN